MSDDECAQLAPRLGVSRDQLAQTMVQYGEDSLARQASTFSDEVMDRVGTLGAYYAFSKDAMDLGGSMGGARALALATVDVVDPGGRPLRRHHSDAELGWGSSEQPTETDAIRDRELRRHARQRQVPADPAKIILDLLDPPAWGPVPKDATPQVARCYELRTKSLRHFTDDDLLFMIGQQVGLNRLVGMAISRLRADPLLTAAHYRGDLLASVLDVDPNFWEPQFDLEVAARKIAEGIRDEPGLERDFRRRIETFIREHPRRSVDHIAD